MNVVGMGGSETHAAKALVLYIMLAPFATNLFCMYAIKRVIGAYKNYIGKQRSFEER